jgi:hypothetical protein
VTAVFLLTAACSVSVCDAPVVFDLCFVAMASEFLPAALAFANIRRTTSFLCCVCDFARLSFFGQQPATLVPFQLYACPSP